MMFSHMMRLRVGRNLLHKSRVHSFSGLTDVNQSNAILRKLFAVNRADRNDQWLNTLYNCVSSANLIVSNKVRQGPDGFDYIDMRVPNADEDLENADMGTLDYLKEQLIENDGYGVAISSTSEEVDWAFSYGDLMHLYLNNTFAPIESSATIKCGEDKIAEGAELVVGEPPESYLPAASRKVLRQFLERYKIKNPRFVHITRKLENGESVQELAFVGTRIPDEVRERLLWFFPLHYHLVVIPQVDHSFPAVAV